MAHHILAKLINCFKPLSFRSGLLGAKTNSVTPAPSHYEQLEGR